MYLHTSSFIEIVNFYNSSYKKINGKKSSSYVGFLHHTNLYVEIITRTQLVHVHIRMIYLIHRKLTPLDSISDMSFGIYYIVRYPGVDDYY